MKVNDLNDESLAMQVAGDDLDEARAQLEQAETIFEEGDGEIETLNHHAYLASTHAEIGLERVAEAKAREELENSEARRTQILLDERTRQAQELADELAELQARETPRGMVLTLGDVLFDTDSATLKAGAESVIDRLAAFMHDNPQHRLMIEGHTDSRGSDAYNIMLSDERADAVRDGLLERGVSPDRMEIRALGEAYPVATNESAAGRQENRRVEIVVSDAQGEFPDSARRVAATR
jgi:outer membrane protein OmpA-like peptidoglycan-associated protein